VQRSGPKRAEFARTGQEPNYRETLIVSDVSVVGRFGQDRRTTLRIPLALQFSLFYEAFYATFGSPSNIRITSEPLFFSFGRYPPRLSKTLAASAFGQVECRCARLVVPLDGRPKSLPTPSSIAAIVAGPANIRAREMGLGSSTRSRGCGRASRSTRSQKPLVYPWHPARGLGNDHRFLTPHRLVLLRPTESVMPRPSGIG